MAVSDLLFDNHVESNNVEFANRQITLKGSGEPNSSSDPSVNNATLGSYYIDIVDSTRYEKKGATPTSWEKAGVVDPDWVVISTDQTPSVETEYVVDTTTNPVEVTLPTPTGQGMRFAFIPLNPTYDTNPLTISTAGGENIMGSATDLIVDQVGKSIEMYYIDPTVGWVVVDYGDAALINNITTDGASVLIELTAGGTPSHTHAVAVTVDNLIALIDETTPSIVVASSTNEGHSHNVTVVYSQGAIRVTNIDANHVGEEHAWRIVNEDTVLNEWVVVTTADAGAGYQLSNADRILADSTGGAFDVILPLSPIDGYIVQIAPLEPTYATNPVTILRNGETINGETEDIEMNQIGMAIELVFVGGSTGWAIIEKGETTVINNVIIDDSGIVVATQPGNNAFTGNNTFTGDNTFSGSDTHTGTLDLTGSDVTVPSITGGSANNAPATKEYVDNSSPTDVAFINQSNTYTSGTNNFTAVEVLIGTPTTNSHPTTKLYVDDLVASSVPTGVAVLADENTFTNTNNFNSTVNMSGNVNITGTTTTMSPTVTIGTNNSTGYLEINSFSSVLNCSTSSTIDIGNGSIFVARFNRNIRIGATDDLDSIDFRGTTATFGMTTSVEVDTVMNVNANNGGEFNIVDDAGSTLVLQAGGDFEVTAGNGGNLWIQGFKMPNADGNAGQLLYTDGDGSLFFRDEEGEEIDQARTITSDWTIDGVWTLNGDNIFTGDNTFNGTTQDFTSTITNLGETNISGVSTFTDTVDMRDQAVDLFTYLDSGQAGSTTIEVDKRYHVRVKTDSGTINYNLPTDTPQSGDDKLPYVEFIVTGRPADVTFTSQSGNFIVNGVDIGTTVYEAPKGQTIKFVRNAYLSGNSSRWWIITGGGSASTDVVLETGTTYTVDAADNGKTIEFNNNSTITLTINTGLGDNFSFTVIQSGDGKIVWGGTATVNNVDSHVRTRGQHAMATFVSRLDGTFTVGGATEA